MVICNFLRTLVPINISDVTRSVTAVLQIDGEKHTIVVGNVVMGNGVGPDNDCW